MEKKSQIIFLEDSKGIVKIKDKIGNLFVLSDDKIKGGDWYFKTEGDIRFEKCDCKEEANDSTDKCKKIIAATNPELLMGEFIDDGSQSGFGFYKDTVASISQSDIEYIVNLYNEKGKEVNVEKLAEKRALFHYPKYANDPDNYESRERIKFGFIDGYNKSLQDKADKKFTLDEVKKAMSILVNIPTSQIADGTYKCYDDAMNFAIQSLTKKQSNNTIMVEYEYAYGGYSNTNEPPPLILRLKDNCIIIHQ